MKAYADSLLFSFIESTNSRYLGQIVSYMNAYIEGYLKGYILSELKEKENVSLNEYVYPDSKNKKEKIETLTSGTSINTEYFSEDLLNILNNLSILERRFIILKYQKQCDNDEISNILNMSLSDIEKLDINILNKLREREDIKLLLLNK